PGSSRRISGDVRQTSQGCFRMSRRPWPPWCWRRWPMSRPLGTPLLRTAVAGATCAAAYLWPETPYLAPTLRPLVHTVAGGWAVSRVVAPDCAWAAYRAWGRNADWIVPAEGLGGLSTPWWRRWTSTQPSALTIGRGFRWDATDTQALETVLARDGRLPV